MGAGGGEEAWIAVSFSCYFIYLFIYLFIYSFIYLFL